jgi:hypothetical protein
MKEGARTPLEPAPTDTPALSVVPTTIRSESVSHPSLVNDWWARWGNKPRYARKFIWDVDEKVKLTSAQATFFYPPMSSVPDNEFTNTAACHTLDTNPHLFKIVTPINVDLFESYLSTHPNRPFVDSVCYGLRHGFWPWAITRDPSLPTTWDNFRRALKDPAHYEFIRAQWNVEVQLGQFSPPFGPELLPGMYSMPLGVVPKPHSDKLRLVFDHSAEPFSLNSMIPTHERSVHLDSLSDLGLALRTLRNRVGPDHELVVFKSDVSRAYRLIPMNKHWQIKQVVTIGTDRHVDRCNQFGSGPAGRIWVCFISLVLWIAIYIKHLTDLFGYVDDEFSWEFADNMCWYEPYHKPMPAKQAALLLLWDELSIPHEEKKQVWGTRLTIIGFEVDPNAMTITMPLESRSDLIQAIHEFAIPTHRHPLRDYQRLAGWVNWSLNVFPLLRPGLSSLYAKISGKVFPHQPIWVSIRLTKELLWITDHLATLSGVHMIDSVGWSHDQAHYSFWADACPAGLGFWSPYFNLGFQYPIRDDESRGIIFYEALAVLLALDFASKHCPSMSRVAIFTDNFDVVDMFNSLKAQPQHNPILLTTVDLLLSTAISLRVFHIPGEQNTIADALSRGLNTLVSDLLPTLIISPFIPPRLTLGATCI